MCIILQIDTRLCVDKIGVIKMLAIDTNKIIIALSNTALPVKDVASKADLSLSLVSKILNGHKKTVRPSTIGKLAKALECKVEDLI